MPNDPLDVKKDLHWTETRTNHGRQDPSLSAAIGVAHFGEVGQACLLH
jgi:hypothetical protein